jgi:hypothetical protein
MRQVYIGDHKKTAVLKPIKITSLKEFYEKLIKIPFKGGKGGKYFTTADEITITLATFDAVDYKNKDNFRRSNRTHLSSWCVCIDGDKSIYSERTCIDPEIVHKILCDENINHIIYSTSSYKPHLDIFKWRCVISCPIPEGVYLRQQHRETVKSLYRLLQDKGCNELRESPESFTLSQMWFLPAVEDPETSPYLTYSYFNGKDYEYKVEVDYESKAEKDNYSPEVDIVTRIVTGSSPLHESINKYIYGNIQDGRKPEAIKATLHGLTANWDLRNNKLRSYKNDINRLVVLAYEKFKNDDDNTIHWEERNKELTRVFTDYPDQGGMMEEIVQCCLDWMIFPNRQIAVTAARTFISTLGARVYTLESGKGIALTALITGRSTIGKSNIKKFFLWLMDNFQLNKTSQEFLGAQYYTAVKNMVKDLNSKYSLLSIRTESGQSDKSTAGDMSRVMAYELEFSTESGSQGYISAGAQNEKIEALFSPGVTTIRESVAKIQSEADILNQTVVSGVAGRRSLILIDPIKGKKNLRPITEIPPKIRKLVLELYKIAAVNERKDCSKPLTKNLWITFKFNDKVFLHELEKKWLKLENKAATLENDFESTFYGRLYERVPAYAGILAVAENPLKPVITNEQLKIAEKSLLAELNAYNKQERTGILDDPLTRVFGEIEKMFIGSMAVHIKYYSNSLKKVGKIELKDGACEWTPITRKLQRYIKNLNEKEKEIFHRTVINRLAGMDIRLMTVKETLSKYGHKRRTFIRT